MIELIIGLVTEVAKYANNAKVNERANIIKAFEQQIAAEKAKGQLSDDGLIESLEERLQIETKALLIFLATAGVSK